MLKLSNTEKLINGVFRNLATLPQQPKIQKTSVILVYGHVHIWKKYIKKPK